jgi:hypothetical protein
MIASVSSEQEGSSLPPIFLPKQKKKHI